MNGQALRERVTYLLEGGSAHLSFEQSVSEVPEDLRGSKVRGVPHTPWRLYVSRRAQWAGD